MPEIKIGDYNFVQRLTTIGEPHTQYCTDSIRKKCNNLISSDAYCTLILTDVDLYPNSLFRKFNFVFGEADYNSNFGIFSYYWFMENTNNLESILKIITHEIGHMYNIDHCIDFNCLMCGFGCTSELENWSMTMCPNCINKLYLVSRFDVSKRHRELMNFYLEHDMTNEYLKLKKMSDEYIATLGSV